VKLVPVMLVLSTGLWCADVAEAQPVRDSVVLPITVSNTVAPAVMQRVTAARALLEQGEGEGARAVLDSLVRVTPVGSMERAEALYWRATLAERVADAERDWRRVVVEIPLSPRTPDVLLRLGDLEMLRQRPVQARGHFERVVREFPGTPQRVRAALWLARSYVEQRELVNGCRAFAALDRVEIPPGELQLQADELRRQCASVPIDSVAVGIDSTRKGSLTATNATNSTGAATSSARPSTTTAAVPVGRYAVQVGAFQTVQEARDAVNRLTGRGFEARIDGEQQPFRVRIGRFATRAEAAKVLAQVKATVKDAFVAELPQ
jgi:cell division septation protein DedD